MAKASTARLKIVDTPPAPTIGSLIEQMADIKRARAKISAEEKKLIEAGEALERELIALLKAQKTDVGMAGEVKATLKTTYFPKIVDDAALWKTIKKNDWFHLYYRRLNQSAYEELLALNKGRPLPGTEVSEKESISLSGVK